MTDTDSRLTDEELPGLAGGAWTEETHQALYPDNFNHGLAKYIVDEIAPTSVLEFGSGLGHLARHLSDHLQIAEVYGIEPNPIKGQYRESGPPTLLPVNIFTDPLPEVANRLFDAVISIEVAEHIDRSLHSQLFDFLAARAARWVIFSAAWIGQGAKQGAHGHIAERDEEDWRSEFTARGFSFRHDRTLAIRRSCDAKNINHRTNLQVFERVEA